MKRNPKLAITIQPESDQQGIVIRGGYLDHQSFFERQTAIVNPIHSVAEYFAGKVGFEVRRFQLKMSGHVLNDR